MSHGGPSHFLHNRVHEDRVSSYLRIPFMKDMPEGRGKPPFFYAELFQEQGLLSLWAAWGLSAQQAGQVATRAKFESEK
jgi:hypothetical protein